MTIKPQNWDEYYIKKAEEEEKQFCQLLRYCDKINGLEKRKAIENGI